MSYVPVAKLDAYIQLIIDADERAVCSQEPTTYFHACRPPVWKPSTAYSIGDLVHPPTANSHVYECTVSGTSGSGEPGWGTAQDTTFSDNTATWKTHKNYALINAPFDKSADTTLADSTSPAGRKVTIAEKMGVVVHTAGEVTHSALISNAKKELACVTVSETDLQGDNNVVAGRTTLLHGFTFIVPFPTVVT
jgi:hypothetical protein